MGQMGNQFWKNRSEHGRDFLFANAALLKSEISKYFNWADAHPLYKVEAIKSGDMAGELIKIPVGRPYSISGLCIYLGASESWWKNFRKNENLTDDFLSVISWAEDVIRTQKIEGATIGAFNANIISRELGLADRLQHEHTGKDGSKLFEEKSDEELKALLAKTIRKLDD